jgi:hypothetical protein
VSGIAVGGRDLCQGTQAVALRLPSDRPVWAGHRRVRVHAARWWCGPVFLHPGAGQHESHPVEVTTDWVELYPRVLDELAPGCLALYEGLRHQPNGSRPRAAEAAPATGAWPERDKSVRIIIAGQAFIENIRRGHYELGVDGGAILQVMAALTCWSWQSEQSRDQPISPVSASSSATTPLGSSNSSFRQTCAG